MQALYQRLLTRDRPIRVCIVGAGDFGAQMATQISHIPNMHVSILCDLDLVRARQVLAQTGYAPEQITVTQSCSRANRCFSAGQAVICEDAFALLNSDFDVLCDVTGEPFFGAELAFRAMEAGKHVVVVNIESDVGFGAALRRKAEQCGVIYTQADGDQPSLIQGLFDWSRCLGLATIAAGKWTCIYPPTLQLQQGKRSDVGYYDGSKNQVELCCVANMTGLLPDVRGMHLPSLAMEEIADAFCSRAEGGIFTQNGVVDAVNCLLPDGVSQRDAHLGGGVFMVAACDNPHFLRTINSKHVTHSRDGKRALLYRPYHLVGIEAPISIMKAVLNHEATASPLPAPVAEVIAIAKRDLPAGTQLDGIGGQCVRGEIERVTLTHKKQYLPLCMAEEALLTRDIPAGQPIPMDCIQPQWSAFIRSLRAQQDALIAKSM